MFVRKWRDDVSLRSSELMVWKEVSDPVCVGVGFMVDIEEDEGSAEWHGVGGRDTGRSPLGVSPSPSSNGPSDGSSGGPPSHSSSSEGKRGRLFGRVDTVNSASCRKIQVPRVGTRKRTDHFVQVLGYSLPPTLDLLSQLFLVRVVNYGIRSHSQWCFLYPSISREMKPWHSEIKDIVDQSEREGNLIRLV
jgi:hypothetical protein